MKAIVAREPLPIEDPRALEEMELPDPLPPAGHDLLVRVEAISVNFLDIKMRRQIYTGGAGKGGAAPAPRILGWDAAGVVMQAGEAATLFRPGDKVIYAGSILRPGSNAEYQLVDERIVGPKPESLDFAAAASLPLTGITAYEALIERLGIDPAKGAAGQSLLVIGAAGGAGSMAIQIGRVLGLDVIATASRPESADWCRALGAGAVLDHREGLKEGLARIGREAVDYILNCASTDEYWEAMTEAIAPQGRICSIVAATKPQDVSLLARKSASFSCESMFTRPIFGTDDLIEQHRLLVRLAGWVDQGRVRSTMREELAPISAANLRAAHAKLESRASIGKIVLAGWA